MKTKKFLALVMALVMAFSLVVPASAETADTTVIIPEPAVLTHDTESTEPHDTAKMTVYVTDSNQETSVAAVGAINSHMDATLELNYGDYPVNGTITAYGQTEKKANMTEFTLNGTSNTDIDFSGESPYFPGLAYLGNGEHYIQFVNAMGTTDDGPIGDYIFKKTTEENKGITLTATNRGNASEVDDNWQTLKGEAFKEDSINDGDSYISLAAGSYIALNTEKLIAAGTLKLDDFSSDTRVQDNIDNAKKQLMLTTGTNLGYQILLKQGTRFKLGNSYADVKTDLLITMEGNAAFNTGSDGDSNLLGNIYTKLTPSGKADLAENMLHLFSYIAGSVQSIDPHKPVVITFGTPTSSSSSSTDGTTTVETTVTENKAGTKDVTTVETVTTKETTTEDNVETTTVTETVTTTSSTVTPKAGATDTSAEYSVNFASQTVRTITTTVGDSEPVQTVESGDADIKTNTVTLKADPADSTLNLSTAEDSANIVNASLDQLTDAAKATIVTEAVARAQESSENVTVTLAIVATALNADGETTKQYDVKPVVTTKVGNGQPTTATVSNADLKGSFTIELPVPATIAAEGKSVKITHTSEEDDTVEEYISTVSGGKASVTISHFSTFELAPVESASNDKFDIFQSLNLESQISINLYVRPKNSASIEDYTITYTRRDNGVSKSEKFRDTTLLTSGYYKIVIGTFAAKQMTETVDVVITDDNGAEVYTNNYSIQEYCNAVFNSRPEEDKLVKLCKATLEYGTYSQRYFNYKLNNLAHEGNDYYTLGNIDSSYAGTNGSLAGVSASMALNLESQVQLIFYFKPLSSKTLTIKEVTNGNTAFTGWKKTESELDSGYTKVVISGIPSGRLNEKYNVTVCCGDSEATWSWSAMSFAHAAQNHSRMNDVSRALANYYKYASEYFK